ncbi:ATP-dependent zinc metalloprotease FtsH [Patescibacteria group bacterium]|nr:ATP-dependent zinc metalloprotease FtsH [Patescibacteria group bacterium]
MDEQRTPPPKPRPPRKVKKFELKLHFSRKRMLLWVIILLLFAPFLLSLLAASSLEEEISLSQALSDIEAGRVERVEVEGEQLHLIYTDEEQRLSRKEGTQTLIEVLEASGIDPQSVTIEVRDQSLGRVWWEILGTILPLVLMGLFFLFLIRQARGAQDSLFSFGRSKAKLFSKGKQGVTFADVGGIEEAKRELEEIVDFLRHPRKYSRLGARTPKGALLVGPSGTGKTLLARAIAGEAGVPFFSMAGSEFMEMLVGVGASRVRDLFNTAKKAAPSIIFIDEIDAIGRMRGMGVAGGHDEREQTLNQILVEMDGFTPNDNVIVLAATNRGDLLDPALLRPGRFDRRVVLDLPDIEERRKILLIHAKGKPITPEVDWKKVSKRTVGFSGADLESMLNEAAILAARFGKKAVDVDDIEEAAMKVKLGPEKRRLQSDLERRMTAYHEAGHAVVGHLLPFTDPVHRVSIVSRGMALGFTLMSPERDKYTQTKSELLDKITALLGGRAAEELVFQELTGGAASDIDQVTRIARHMVMNFGMSDLGPVKLGPQWDTTDLGRPIVEPSQISEDMQAQVDREIRKIVDAAYKKAVTVLVQHREKLDAVVESLLEKESVDGDEFVKIMGVPKAKTALDAAKPGTGRHPAKATVDGEVKAPKES